MKIEQKPSFKKVYKKLYKNQLEKVNEAIRAIVDNPLLGKEKQGDLSGVFVYKFDCINQQYLLAYRFSDAGLELIKIDAHQNFYRDLKNQIKS